MNEKKEKKISRALNRNCKERRGGEEEKEKSYVWALFFCDTVLNMRKEKKKLDIT